MILYHYTSSEKFNEFLRTKQLCSPCPSSMTGVSPAQNWYFTDLEPWHCDLWTSPHCWRGLFAFEKAEYYLKLDVPDAIVVLQDDHLYALHVWDDSIEYLEGKRAPSDCKNACPFDARWPV